MRSVVITGTRGIPACHGGFETFAERLAVHLAGRGWQVGVTCQSAEPRPRTERWNGITLHHIPQRRPGPLGTIIYDLGSALSTLRTKGLVLTLGYNTAAFAILQRLARVPAVINMDGLEWRRPKWPMPVRAWFYANERLAPLLARHVVADHPVIAERLRRRLPPRRLSMIPYGADAVENPDPAPLARFGLRPDGFALLVARLEPDNSVLEIVRAFSSQPRGIRLCVLGTLTPDAPYHRALLDAASPEVTFAGASYDPALLAALRGCCRFYLHGHRFGGTNPSLVEALGAGCAVLAHDNSFNRWVAGDAMVPFAGIEDCDAAIARLAAPEADLQPLRVAARRRHADAFTWPAVLIDYERMLEDVLIFYGKSRTNPA